MIGRTLSHYRILSLLGSGGMGQVYLAEDTRLKRKVALKVLPAGLASDPTRLGRFQREAEALAALSHPNIVTIYSVEDADGVHFMTMEHIDGEPLSRLIPSEGIDLGRFFDLAVPLADAVAVAHERGIMHRDLKPANVMVGTDGRAQRSRFRAGEDCPGDAVLTARLKRSSRRGKARSSAPSRTCRRNRSQGLPVDYRSDIFSLGVHVLPDAHRAGALHGRDAGDPGVVDPSRPIRSRERGPVAAPPTH